MAEKTVSPGVFTEEKDLSFLPQGIANIGAAFIGPTLKGPAMVPTSITSYGEFVQTFGDTDQNLYLPYTAKEYLQNSGQLTVVRTLHDDGYKLQDPIAILASGSAGQKVVAVLHPTQILNETDAFYNGTTALFEKSTLASNASGSAVISVSGSYVVNTSDFATGKSNGSAVYSASLNSSNANFLTKVFGQKATSTTDPVYLYNVFTKQASASLAADAGTTFVLRSGSFDFLGTYAEAKTPWVISQTVNNSNSTLFKFHTISHGVHTNYETKIAISNIKPAGSVAGSEYGSFTVTVRLVDTTYLKALGTPYEATDSDVRPNIVESFDNVNLDPNSVDYIARRIGDRYRTFVNGKTVVYGDYPNKSKYVYVEMDENVTKGNYSNQLVPFGFQSLYNTVPSTLTATVSSPAIAASATITNVSQSLAWWNYLSNTGEITASYVFKINTNTGTYFFQGFSSSSYWQDNTFTNTYYFELSGSNTVDVQSFVNKVNSGSFFAGVSASIVDSYGVKFTATTAGTTGNSFFVTAQGPTETTYNFSGGIAAQGSDGFPAASYVAAQTVNSIYNKRKHFGFEYDFASTDNVNYLKPVPNANVTTGSNVNFVLSNFTQHPSANFPTAATAYSGSIDLSSNTSIDSRKFIVPFQGGSDGIQPNRRILVGSNIVSANTQGYDLNGSSGKDYSVYKNAIDAVSNPDELDINMLVMPGVIQTKHAAVIDYAANMCQDRGDTFFVFDCVGLTDSIATATDAVSALDNNYGATYYPWVKIVDVNINKPVWVPPSVVIPGVLAFNDRVAAEWYAPAGLNRGGLTSVLDAYTRLTHAERDTLYEGRVNPIATFPGVGVCVWGQKTLQAKPSALDRINVRRLLIAVKKFIASATKYLVFENNTAATRNRFLNIVNPYLESVQQRQGLYAFRVVMDETNNTPDVIDRNIMYGQIFLQPAKTAEFIIIDFNILPTGAAFPGA
jgi:hypothetical protein